MNKKPTELSVNELHAMFEAKGKAIRARLADFKLISTAEYFYELAYCLLTPQSAAVNAAKAVYLLQQNDFLHSEINPEPLLHQKEFYIRFHKTKAKHLLAAKAQFPMILTHLMNATSARELRAWLVRNVTGLGWKEASHFLRNIGYENLAILDRHVLRNLVRAGVLLKIPKTLTAKRYLAIEKKFFKFAQQIGISADELDLLFWSMETGVILK